MSGAELCSISSSDVYTVIIIWVGTYCAGTAFGMWVAERAGTKKRVLQADEHQRVMFRAEKAEEALARAERRLVRRLPKLPQVDSLRVMKTDDA